jgi:hypothetical protein
MPEVFTQQRPNFYLGLCLSALFVFFLTFHLVGTCCYYDGPPGNWIYLLLSGVLLYSAMLAVSVWLLLAYFRESICLEGDQVRFAHVVRRWTVTLSEVTRVRWRRNPLSLKLSWQGGSDVVRFGEFRPAQRQRLLRYFREHLRPEVQEGWGESLEGYDALAQARQTAEETDRVFRRWWRWVLVGGVTGLGCGLALLLYAGRMGVGAPTWTGSVLLDWAGGGVLVIAGGLAGLRVLVWMGLSELD